MTIEEQARSLKDFETAVSFVSAQRCLEEQRRELEERNRELEQQLSWFKKQLFGERSEKRAGETDPRQLSLGELLSLDVEAPRAEETVKAYHRRAGKTRSEDAITESGLRQAA